MSPRQEIGESYSAASTPRAQERRLHLIGQQLVVSPCQERVQTSPLAGALVWMPPVRTVQARSTIHCTRVQQGQHQPTRDEISRSINEEMKAIGAIPSVKRATNVEGRASSFTPVMSSQPQGRQPLQEVSRPRPATPQGSTRATVPINTAARAMQRATKEDKPPKEDDNQDIITNDENLPRDIENKTPRDPLHGDMLIKTPLSTPRSLSFPCHGVVPAKAGLSPNSSPPPSRARSPIADRSSRPVFSVASPPCAGQRKVASAVSSSVQRPIETIGHQIPASHSLSGARRVSPCSQQGQIRVGVPAASSFRWTATRASPCGSPAAPQSPSTPRVQTRAALAARPQSPLTPRVQNRTALAARPQSPLTPRVQARTALLVQQTSPTTPRVQARATLIGRRPAMDCSPAGRGRLFAWEG